MSSVVSTPKRGRRLTRQERRAQTQRDLMRAASEVFAMKGFHASSVDDVAERAGYSKGAVYSNFDSKEDLLLELIRSYSSRRLDSAAAGVAKAGRSKEARIKAGADILTSLVDVSWVVSQLSVEFWANATREASIGQKLRESEELISSGVEELLKEQIEELNLKPSMPVAQATEVLMAAADGFLLRRTLNPTKFDRAFYQEAFERILRSVLLT